MNLSRRFLTVVLMLALMPIASVGAQTAPRSAAAPLPQYVRFAAELKDSDGKPASGVVGITFLLYEEEKGGAPLWLETQNVALDEKGRFAVMLGAATPDGLPAELFTAKQARWLAMEPQGLPAPTRVMLVSVPYALKAGDAETFGGLSPAAFLREAQGGMQPADARASASSEAQSLPAGGGKAGFVPLWMNGAGTLGNSALFQSGAGSTAKVGIGTATPAAALDVKGGVIARGALQLPSKSIASAAQGSASQPLALQASAFDSTAHKVVLPEFQWQAEPHGNNTTNPSGSLNLLYSSTGSPAETGLSIAGNGRITFAAGQTFPGAGKGTITAISPGAGLAGGGTSGSVMLGIDTTKVPLLNAANTFTGDQAVTGNLQASATVSGSTVNAANGFNLGGNPFAFGSYTAFNSFVGFAGNSRVTGLNNVGVGRKALFIVGSGHDNTAQGAIALVSNDAGSNNSAFGSGALWMNTKGEDNTAIGYDALSANNSGSFNTALGAHAGPDPAHPALTNATAIGANATVTASNSLVLGSINGVNNATADTLVGIGTTAPTAKLDVHGTANFTDLVTFAAGQAFPGTITGVTAGTGLSGGGTSGSPTLSLNTTYSDGRYAQLGANNTFTGRQIINNSLGIGISPSFPLHVNGTMRAETGLSLGGAAALSVDAPGIPGGHFLVTGGGNVGINNTRPGSALDVGGNINASGNVTASGTLIGGSLNVGGATIAGGISTTGISASAGVTVGAGLSAASVKIGGDTPMSAAPHLMIGGYVPAPLNAGAVVVPIFMIPTRSILITRMSAYGMNQCHGGDETYTLYVGSSPNSQAAKYTLTISISTISSDSGALSIAVAAQTPVWVFSNSTPSCEFGAPAAGNIAVSVEYVMQ